MRWEELQGKASTVNQKTMAVVEEALVILHQQPAAVQDAMLKQVRLWLCGSCGAVVGGSGFLPRCSASLYSRVHAGTAAAHHAG